MLNSEEMAWLEETLAYLNVKGDAKTERIMGDASSRNYFRVYLGRRTFILCRSSDAASNERFRCVSAALEQVGVMAPLVFAYDEALGLMLLSDLGNTTLLDFYQMNASGHPYSLVHRILNDLLRLAQIPDPLLSRPDGPVVGEYNQALLDRDFGLFTEWCLTKALSLEVEGQPKNIILASMSSLLSEGFRTQPQVWVHRDFHCRNLMLTDSDIAMIDFQDMVKGPVCYDLISLIYDAYWNIPQDQKGVFVRDYYQQLLDVELVTCGLDEFQQWVAITAMQRLLKVVGIFCRLALRDGKQGYLSDLPLVIQHIESLHNVFLDLWPQGWVECWQEEIAPAMRLFLESNVK